MTFPRWVVKSKWSSLHRRKTDMPIIITDASKLVVTTQQSNTSQQTDQSRRLNVRNDGTRLYVNGKERKIGKKSQYLLDMLTLED